jgi:hypothetical protein
MRSRCRRTASLAATLSSPADAASPLARAAAASFNKRIHSAGTAVCKGVKLHTDREFCVRRVQRTNLARAVVASFNRRIHSAGTAVCKVAY